MEGLLIYNLYTMANDIKSILAAAKKKYGSDAVNFFGDTKVQEVPRISTGFPSIDYVLGGGLPKGRIIQLFGPYSSGKSTLALQFVAQLQRTVKDKSVLFIDLEHGLDPKYAEELGVDMDKLVFAQPNSAEETLNLMRDLGNSGAFSMIVLDSVDALRSQKEIEGSVGDSEMAMRARLLGQALRSMVSEFGNNGCIGLFINQTRSSMQMFGPTETTSGGKALPFFSSVILKCQAKKDYNNNDRCSVTITAKKNKVAPPYRSTELRLNFGQGFDLLYDLASAGKNMGIVNTVGQNHSFGSNEWKTENGYRKAVASNEDLQKALIKEIQKAYKK